MVRFLKILQKLLHFSTIAKLQFSPVEAELSIISSVLQPPTHPPPGKVSDKLNLHDIDLKHKAKMLDMLC